MTLSSAIKFYEETLNDPSIAILTILKQASYEELYVYFAYELPFDTTWGETQVGNDYLMRKIRGLHADDILQYEVERSLPMELITLAKCHGGVSPLRRRSTRNRDPGTHAG